jgi:hypothetical protein
MSINKLISIKNAIVDAQDMLALDHNSMLPLFMGWATYAEKEIGGAGVIRKFAVLDICGCVACLPDDISSIKGAILGNHETNCGALFNSNVFRGTVTNVNADAQFVIIDAGSIEQNVSCGIVPYAIQDNKLVFSQDLSATHITIMYDGFATDCDGFIKIGENHVAAISEYIQYMYWKRKRNKSRGEMESMNMAYREWDRLCAHARALDGELTPTEREELARLWNDPYAGRGLITGMTTNNDYGFSY